MTSETPAYKNVAFITQKFVYCLVELDEVRTFGLREKDKTNIQFTLELIKMLFDAREEKVIRNLIGRSRASYCLFVYQGKVKEFLLDRSNELEDFAPKLLTEEQQAKINEISNFLTGKASASYPSANQVKPASEDFEFEDSFTTTSSSNVDETEDDFFSDL